MKRALICAVILASMVTAGTALYINTNRVIDRLDARLAALGEEGADVVSETAAISGEWEEFCAGDVFLTNLEGAAEISQTLVRLAAAAVCDRDDIPEECLTARYQLAHFRESRRLCLDNIF